jgi:hypothetical protein
MSKKILIVAIRLVFTAAAIGFVNPLILPFFHFHGGLLGATIAGAALLGLYPLMRKVIYKLMGLVEGACPMPRFQLWLVLAFWAGTSIVLWLASLIAPAWLQCGGIFGAIPAGFIVLFCTTLSNIFTRPISGGASSGEDAADDTKK